MEHPKHWYICHHPACRKPFKRKQDWARHMDVHLGITYHCAFCQISFTRESSVKKHQETCKMRDKSKDLTQEDATILDVTQVKPIQIGISQEKSYTDKPPKIAKIQKTAWVATGQCKSTSKAIKILTRYEHSAEPLKPSQMSKQKLDDIKSKITPPQLKKEFKWRTKPSTSLDPGEGTSSGILRVPTLAKAHCSDIRAVKRHHSDVTPDTTGSNSPAHNATSDKLTDNNQAQVMLDMPMDFDTSPKKVRFNLPSPNTTGMISSTPPPTNPLDDPQYMDGPGGSPFPTDPDVPIDNIWSEILDTPKAISPIQSPRLIDQPPGPNQMPVISVVLPESNPLDLIGFISSSSEDEEKPPSPAPPKPKKVTDDYPDANATILDIISEISIINEISLSTNLGKYQKSLNKVNSILMKVNKKIAKK